MSKPAIHIDGETLRVCFDSFDIESYQLFLQVKRLPEYQLQRDDLTEAYSITAPARFAPMLGVELPKREVTDLPLAEFLFDDQKAITEMALAAKRFAYWGDCGLGKTLVEYEFARQVAHRTGERVLIVTLNEVIPQYVREIAKFYGDAAPLLVLNSREEMKRWCETGKAKDDSDDGQAAGATHPDQSPDGGAHQEGVDGASAGDHPGFDASARGSVTGQPERRGSDRRDDAIATSRIAIVNYEKFNHKSDADQVVNELRYLSGIVLDESSRLKSGGGKQKWALIKSARGIPYKLSCTATPAPNEIMEFASQASFLEKMRSDNDIIWTYFRRDEKTHRWTVKRHARAAFFEFMSSWSIYVRDPRRYGWRKDIAVPPVPETHVHEIEPTRQQREFVMEFNTQVVPAADRSGTPMMFTGQYNAIQSTKLSQAAKGFNYVKEADGRGVKLIDSKKPISVVALALTEAVLAGVQVLVWSEYDAEIDIISKLLNETDKYSIKRKRKPNDIILPGPCPKFEVLTGKVPNRHRQAIKDRFTSGETRILITRSDLMGYGQNLQMCGTMIFSGWSYSYEDFYQAIRRAYRFGQEQVVRIHVPVIRELEGQMWDAICRKQGQHEAAIAEMEANYIAGFKAVQRWRQHDSHRSATTRSHRPERGAVC